MFNPGGFVGYALRNLAMNSSFGTVGSRLPHYASQGMMPAKYSVGHKLRELGSTALQGFPFGAGYSFGTYAGFPGNYQGKKYNLSKASFTMPYGYYRSYYPRRSYRRYRRSRYRPRYTRGYRRYY